VVCWRNLLKDKDTFSLSFQNFVKFLPAFLEHSDNILKIETKATENFLSLSKS
jgi:hypothetical protein